MLERPCFSHLKQSCLGVVHCFLLAHFYLQAARTLTGVLLSERRLSAACCPPSSFLVRLRLLGTSLNEWLATTSQVSRSEERRVGKECGGSVSNVWWWLH